MSVRVHIPDSVAQAIRLPEDRIDEELRVELAIALYAQRLLSFGKARELAEKGKYEFGRLIAKSLGLKVTGVLGILLRARWEGKVSSMREAMDTLQKQAGFRIGRALYTALLKESGEYQEM